jgi:glutathione S-transferase
MDALDELARNNNTPLLRPPGQEERIRDLCDNGRESLERRLYTRWMWWLTGVRRPEEYKALFLEHWQEMEDALGASNRPYFLGKDPSLIDLRFIPFVERQIASLVYYKGATYLRDATKYPNIVRWLEAMGSRPSYQATKSDYYTHSRALPPQLAAGCAAEPGCEEIQEAIDSYPVGNGSSDWTEPGWSWSANPAQEAAEALILGGDKIVSFAARGAGVAGFPAASAPLADPAATPNEVIMPALDLILRAVAMSLVQSQNPRFSNNGTNNESVMATAIPLLDYGSAQSLADCLDYLRTRIGVPRDMSYPAAQVLRMELLQISEMLGDQASEEDTRQTRVESNKIALS